MSVQVITELQRQTLNNKLAERKKRVAPEILIVEDMAFSRNMLLGMLGKKYKCHIAKDGAEAVHQYATNAPDITFLDIELPDVNGHSLARLFKEVDPGGYLVMLTANNYTKDMEAAKANKVQGFIAKPYSKQKIDEAIMNYIKGTLYG